MKRGTKKFIAEQAVEINFQRAITRFSRETKIERELYILVEEMYTV